MEFTIDHLIVLVFLGLTLMVGMNHGRTVKTIRDYALGGRNFSTGALVATIVATYASGSNFIATINKTYTEGFYYMFATIGVTIGFFITAIFIIPRMGEFLGNISIAEAMGDLYGKNVRIITAIAGTIGSIGGLAVQFKAFGSVIAYFINLTPTFAIVVSGFIVTIYSAFGGIRAVTFTDILQFCAFAIIIPLVGFIIWGQIYNTEFVVVDPMQSPKFNLGALFSTSNEGFWGFIILLIYFSMPTISAQKFQRISMGSSIGQAKKSFIYAATIFALIQFAVAWIPFVLHKANPSLTANQILPYIIDTFSFTGLKGLIIIAFVSFAMSTADSRINSASTLFTHDLYTLITGNEEKSLFVARLFACLLGVGTIILSLTETDLLTIIVFANSFYYPLVVPPFLLAIFGFRSSPLSALIGMLVALLITVLWKFLPANTIPTSQGVIGVFCALGANTLFLFLIHYLFKQKGGWIGIKDQEGFSQDKEASTAYYAKFVSAVKDFNLKEFFQQIRPHNETTYTAMGAYMMLYTISTMYTTQSALMSCDNQLIRVIYPSMLVISTLMSIYYIWPANIFKLERQKIIGPFYLVSIFYMLSFLGVFFSLLTNFAMLQTLLFSINIMIVSILLGWRLSLFSTITGFCLGVYSYQTFFNGNALKIDLGSPDFVLLYFMLCAGVSIILFLKPKQEYLENTEASLDRSEHDVKNLTSNVRKKKKKIEFLQDKVDFMELHANFRKQELNNALELKNEFIRNLEHEGRTPLAGMAGMADVLLDCYDQMDEARRKETIKSIAQSSARFNSYVSNMVDLSALKCMSYDLTIEPVNVTQLVEERLELCQRLHIRTKDLAKYEFKLELEKGVTCQIDRYYLTQVIDNLVINAVNYAKGGIISLKLKQVNDLIHFTISDQGPGVPEQEKLDIFEPFIVSSRTRTPAGGRGVGLALCKTIIDVFHGKIEVENNQDKGATFSLELPREQKSDI